MIFNNIYYRSSPNQWQIGIFDIYKIQFIIVKAANNYFIELNLYPKNNTKRLTAVIDIYTIALNEWDLRKLVSYSKIINTVRYCIEKYQTQSLFIFTDSGLYYGREAVIRSQEVDLK